jgi:hypothetical protein
MNTSYLTRSLAGFFKLMFWFTVINLIFSLGRELFTKDGKIGSLSGAHHSSGYSIPVKLNVTIYDSIVNYKDGSLVSEQIYYKNYTLDSDTQLLLDSLRAKPNVIKNISETEILIGLTDYSKNFFSENDYDELELTNSKIKTEASVQVKASSAWLNVLLFINRYISLVLIILMLYFLKDIFMTLKERIEFRYMLSKKVKILGLILIFGVVLKLILSLFFYFNYDIITIQSSINDVIISNPTAILIEPRLNFKLGLFIIGISLIILSALLKEGNRIQSDNELTI